MPYTDTPPTPPTPGTAADGTLPGNSQTQVIGETIGELLATQQLLDGGRGTAGGAASDMDTRLTADEALIGASSGTFLSLTDVHSTGPTPSVGGNLYVTLPGGGIVLCPRSVFLKTDGTYEAWLATVTGFQPSGLNPLTITRHSVPAGAQGVAYASTTFAASGGCQFPCTWKISTAGDPIPAGMTFTDNGDNTATLAGTPTGSGTSNIIVDATDALGTIDEETYALTIAATGSSFAFALPAFSDFHVGDTVSHDLTHDCTNPAGALSFTSYSNAPITGVYASAAFNTFTKTGLTVANDTVVAFQGLTNIAGISNNTSYWVVNSTAGTGFQIALTKGGAVIDLAGTDDANDITIQFPSLPTHHLALSGSTLQTSTAFTAADVGTISFWITAFDGATHISSRGTIKVLAVNSGPTITTTTVPAGTKNSTYTSTTFAATDTDPGALPLVWSLDATSDALPAGMTFTGGVLAGTPTVFGTYHLVMKVVDNNGASDTQAVTLTVAQAAGSFAFNLPASLPDATPGTDYLYDASTVCTNPAGALTFDSYSNVPVTSVAMNNAGDTLTWSGQVASIANGTVVALEGVTGTPGVLNGPTNTYFVVGSGTRSVQLANTAGGSAIAFTADLTGLTIQFPSLPNQHFSLDPATGHVTAPAAQIANAVAFWLRAFDGATHIAKQTSISVSAAGPYIDILTLSNGNGAMTLGGTLDEGARTVAGCTMANAWQNAKLINTAAAQMAAKNSVSGQLRAGDGVTHYDIWISGDPTNYTDKILQSGNDSTDGLDHWNLPNVTFHIYPKQVCPASGQAPHDLFLQRTSWVGVININAHGICQYQDGEGGSPNGYYSNGVTFWNSRGPAVGKITEDEGRSLVGATATRNGMTVPECFNINLHNSVGGNNLEIHETTNGKLSPGFSRSGCDTQYMHDTAASPAALTKVKMFATGMRHGYSHYCGGITQIMPGSIFDGCGHAVQMESGTVGQRTFTRCSNTMILGDPTGADTTPVIIRNGPAGTSQSPVIGVQSNGNGEVGNGQSGANGSPYGLGPGIHLFHVEFDNMDAANCYPIFCSGKAIKTLEVHSSTVDHATAIVHSDATNSPSIIVDTPGTNTATNFTSQISGGGSLIHGQWNA